MRRATGADSTDNAAAAFQSTLSMRRATLYIQHADWDDPSFQSTLSMRRATLSQIALGVFSEISIHALHEESDPSAVDFVSYRFISIHALHEESDSPYRLPTGRAIISIHALHEESDHAPLVLWRRLVAFQSTLSMRRATIPRPAVCWMWTISIHALHEESDRRTGRGPRPAADFNPRSP